jgi:hypothetical protein
MYVVREYACCEGSRDAVWDLLAQFKDRYLRAVGISGMADGAYYLAGWKGWVNPLDGPACYIDAVFVPADGVGEFDLNELESRISAVSMGEQNVMADQLVQCQRDDLI